MNLNQMLENTLSVFPAKPKCIPAHFQMKRWALEKIELWNVWGFFFFKKKHLLVIKTVNQCAEFEGL